MGQPEIRRSGENTVGDNATSSDVDPRQQQAHDGLGPVPEGSAPGHRPEADPDRPIEKFARRAGGAAGDDRTIDDAERDDGA